ncbi:MAG: hypothetical protein AB8B47_16180 [Roseobacter sp.]
MKRAVLILSLLGLAACGADGEPVRPSVSGGVTINQNGVYPSVGVGVAKGPLSLFLNL